MVRNVLIACTHDSAVGGVQAVVRDLTRGLEQHGIRVAFIYALPVPSIRLRERPKPSGARAFYCPMPTVVRDSPSLSLLVFTAYLPVVLFQLARLMRREKIDVVNAHYLDPSFLHLVIACRLLRVPIVISVHGSDVKGYAGMRAAQRFVHRLIMRGADRVVACSQALAARTIEVFPTVREKITGVHNGLDDSRYPEVRERDDLPQRFVLSVSRHVRVKGVDTLLRAFALICNEVPDLSLVLVGDGPLRSEHTALAGTLGIGHRVIFMGEVAPSDIPSFLSKCAVFVLPSRSEGFGIAVLEAAFHKKPIVCTRVGGIPEIIANGVNGLLVEPDNPSDMAGQILCLLRNPTVARELGRQAYQTLMGRFLWKHRIHDYIAVYEGRPADSDTGGRHQADRLDEDRFSNAGLSKLAP